MNLNLHLNRHNRSLRSKAMPEPKSIWDKAPTIISLFSLFIAVAAVGISLGTEKISIEDSSAYIFPDLNQSVSTTPELNRILASSFKLTNFGQTPATNVRYSVTYNFPMCIGYPTVSQFSKKMLAILNGPAAYADSETFPAPNLASQGEGNSFLAQFSNPHLDKLLNCSGQLKELQIYVYVSYDTIFGAEYRTGTLINTSFFGPTGANIYTAKTSIVR